MADLSIADVMALDKNGDDNNMWNNPFVYLVWIWAFSAFGGGFGGFGGNNAAIGNYVTNAEMQDQFNFAALERQNNENVAAVRQAQLDTVGATKDLAYTNLSQIRDVESQLTALQAAQDMCCCTTNRNIDSVKFENCQNTGAIVNAIHAEGEATRALINQNTVQELRDKLTEKDREILASGLINSQCAQTQQLIATLRPFPTPAYITCSPYTSAYNPYENCGCGCTNGCGC